MLTSVLLSSLLLFLLLHLFLLRELQPCLLRELHLLILVDLSSFVFTGVISVSVALGGSKARQSPWLFFPIKCLHGQRRRRTQRYIPARPSQAEGRGGQDGRQLAPLRLTLLLVSRAATGALKEVTGPSGASRSSRPSSLYR